jgi:transcriptional regulator with XRE-family HTH domain
MPLSILSMRRGVLGRAARKRPKRLHEKVAAIRDRLGLTQKALVESLDLGEIDRSMISKFERGICEPPLPVLLRYARVAGICLEILIDEEADIPAKLPCKPIHHAHDLKC